MFFQKYLLGLLVIFSVACSTVGQSTDENRRPAQQMPSSSGVFQKFRNLFSNPKPLPEFYIERQRWDSDKKNWKYCKIDTQARKVSFNTNPRNSENLETLSINSLYLKKVAILQNLSEKILRTIPKEGLSSESIPSTFPGFLSYTIMTASKDEMRYLVNPVMILSSNKDLQNKLSKQAFGKLHRSCETRLFVKLMDEICYAASSQAVWVDIPAQFYPPQYNCQ